MGKKLMYLTIVSLVLGPVLAASATPGPAAWWKFDETSGAIAADSVGGLNGDLMPADPNGAGLGPQWVAGKIDGALQLDGTDDHVVMPIGNLINTLGSTTFALWANWSRTGGGWQRIFDFGSGTSIYAFLAANRGGTDSPRFAMRSAAVGEQVVTAPATLGTGWHHMAIVIDGSAMTLKFYFDGAVVASGTTTILPKNMGVTTQNWIARSQYASDAYYKGGIDELRIYDRALTGDEVINAMVGGLGYGLASNPVPADKATDVWREQKLSWSAGPEAKTHDVYFGTDLSAVTNASSADQMGVLVSAGQTGTTYNPGRLELGATCYWRVDEIGPAPDYVVYKGNVWTFTVEPVVYTIAAASITATASSSTTDMGPEKTIDGSGLNAAGEHSTTETDMWLSASGGVQPTWILYAFDKVYALEDMLVWNSNQALESIVGYGAKSVTVEYGIDPNALTKLGDVTFNQAPGTAACTANTTVAFNNLPVKYVKLTMNSNWGGLFQQYGLSEVRFTRSPLTASYPSPASGTTGLDPKLVTMTWRPGRQAAKHEVYLSTDQKAVADGTVLAGTVTTPKFEKALELDRTYYWKITEVNQAETPAAWAGDVWNFSTQPYYRVYNFTSTADRTLKYDTDRPLKFAITDWTLGGAKTLVITFTGTPGNAPGQLFIQISGSQNRFYVDMPDLTKQIRQQWNLSLADLASTGLNLKSVQGMTIGVLSEGSGTITLNDILLYRSAPAVPTPKDPGKNGLAALYAMEGNVNDSSGNGLNGTTTGDPVFVAGQAGYGKALSFDSVDDFATLPIGDLINSLSNMTVATWVNFGGGGGWWQRPFDFGSGTGIYAFLCARVGNSGTMRFAIRTATVSEQVVNSAGNLPTNSWHHVAITINASTMSMALYLDGSVVGTGATTLLPKDMGVTTQNYLGKSQWPDALYLGLLDDFRIYNRVLSEGELHYLAGDR